MSPSFPEWEAVQFFGMLILFHASGTLTLLLCFSLLLLLLLLLLLRADVSRGQSLVRHASSSGPSCGTTIVLYKLGLFVLKEGLTQVRR